MKFFPSFGKKGFTLIEVMVVITIIGLMTSIVIGPITETRKIARDTRRIAELHEIKKAVELYRMQNGSYPGGSDTYYDSRSPSQWATFGTALAPYMPQVPVDPSNGSCFFPPDGSWPTCDSRFEYLYHGYGNRFMISTYLESATSPQTGSNSNGTYYTVTSDPRQCPGTSFFSC